MLGGISIWQLLIVLAIIIMIFGTKKLRNLGGDLGGAIKSFKKAVNENDEEAVKTPESNSPSTPRPLPKADVAGEKDADFIESKDKNSNGS